MDGENRRKFIPIKWTHHHNYISAELSVEIAGRKGTWEIVIETRPPYCDRGRFIAKVFAKGVLPPDHQESFPRYYFDFERAKAEMQSWVNVRQEIIS